MTNEKRCLLAGKCKKAGQEGSCNDLCFAFRKMHGEKGTGGLWGLAGVPKAYERTTLGNLPFKDENPTAYELLQSYGNNVIENVGNGIGLYLFSIPNQENRKGTGTGKTTASVAVLNAYLVERVIQHIKQEREIKDIPALFQKVAKFQNVYNAQFRGTIDMKEEASLKYYTIKKRLMDVDLLVFDDIGIREASEAFKNEFYEIIDERASEQKPTIFTSNVPIEVIGDLINEQVASRIEGCTLAIPFEGKDFRKGGVLK